MLPQVAFLRDSHMVASGHHDGTLRLWDLRNKRVAHEIAGLHSQICALAVGASGSARHVLVGALRHSSHPVLHTACAKELCLLLSLVDHPWQLVSDCYSRCGL